MLDASRREILERLAGDDLVLDVGGWAKPFARADWVLDLMPFDTRGLYGYDQGARAEERFTGETWITRDICAREPWPFADDEFDFAVCSHTLEDVRDPVYVCSELQRVARAGYIETPSRLEEQAWGVQGPWVGWGHHHWLVETAPGWIQFVFKHQIVHGRPEFQLPREAYDALAPEQRVARLFWDGGFECSGRVFIDSGELDAWLAAPVGAHRPASARRRRLLRR